MGIDPRSDSLHLRLAIAENLMPAARSRRFHETSTPIGQFDAPCFKLKRSLLQWLTLGGLSRQSDSRDDRH